MANFSDMMTIPDSEIPPLPEEQTLTSDLSKGASALSQQFQNFFGYSPEAVPVQEPAPYVRPEWMNSPGGAQPLDTPIQNVQIPASIPQWTGYPQPAPPINKPYPMNETRVGGVPWRPEEPKPPAGGVADQPENPAPEWSKGPKSYAEQVADKMNQPFLPGYNYLQYGKPLEFDGTDQVAVTSGKNWTNIKDRPLTLAELDPMKVKEKDWGKYLEASVKAMSTASFDAAKDPGVIQQMQALSSQYYAVKAKEIQMKSLAKQRKLVEGEAERLEALAGIKAENKYHLTEHLAQSNANEAARLRNQAEKLSRVRPNDPRVESLRAASQELEEKAHQTYDSGTSEANENSLFWQNQAAKLRETAGADLDEKAQMTGLAIQAGEVGLKTTFMQAMNVGQSQEEADVFNASERAYTEGQRAEKEAESALQGTTAEERVKNRAEAQARSQGLTSATNSEKRADDIDQELKDLNKRLEGYALDPKTQKATSLADMDLPPLTAEEFKVLKAKAVSLARARDTIRAKAYDYRKFLDPTFAALTDVSEEAPTPMPEEPGKFRPRFNPAATFQGR